MTDPETAPTSTLPGRIERAGGLRAKPIQPCLAFGIADERINYDPHTFRK